MNNHKVLATFVVAILVASALVAAGRMIPLQNASAQTVTIKTSADSHVMKFFGSSFLQVIVTDPDKDDDNVQEEVSVEIDADPSGSFTSSSGTFIVPETSDSSSRFEFYLAFDSSTTPAIDADNSNGVAEYTGSNTEAPIIRFGGEQELPVTSGLFDDVNFDITVGNEEISVDYEESSGVLELDRSSYGSDSLLHLFIVDQDANIDPTNTDSFTLSNASLNASVFELDGAIFNSAVTFDETGDNTARFEAIITLGTEIVASNDAIQITLDDRANYDDPVDSSVNDSLDTSSKSFDIDNADGELDDIPDITFASELKLTLRDNDQNKDSEDSEDLPNAVNVTVDTTGGDVEFLDLTETDDNTGVFIIDLSNSELPVTFLSDGALPTVNNSKLELRQDDINEDILVDYTDPLDDNDAISITSSFTLEMNLATGSVDVPDAAGINNDFLLTLTDADLNDNPRTKDSYTFVPNQVGPYELKKGGNPIGELVTLEFEIEGNPLDFGTQSVVYTLLETDINVGVFTAEIDMKDLLGFGEDGGRRAVDDGDTLRVTYNDLMDDVAKESSDELMIGESGTPNGDTTCMGLAATIVGTDDNDVLNGTPRADVIVGLRGNDTINGMGGDDIICGGLGLDQLSGGEGDDKLLGGNANDIISGDDGNDMIWGGTGWDRLTGGLGNDILRGGIGNDHLAGGDGNDWLFGQEGSDHLDGGTGDNVLVQD